MSDRLQELAAFVRTAECGSFSQASRELGLSQPSITAAIARSVPLHDLGIAGAANRLMGQGGAAFGIMLLALAYGGRDTPDAFALAFAVGGALSAASVATAFGIGIHPIEPGA